jgi:SAM-dependent methyltransferase
MASMDALSKSFFEGDRMWVKKGNRLALFLPKAGIDFWSRHWSQIDIGRRMQIDRKDLFLLNIFHNYLPHNGKVIEAGCGLGQWVKILREEGYDIEGIDFSEETVRRTKRYDPSLSVRVGNILHLPYPDNHFAGCISLGVVEHLEEGPENALKEAHRVLSAKGTLLVSVPYINPLRKLKGAVGVYRYRNEKQIGEFHQYCFTKTEFTSILRDSGFRVIIAVPFAVMQGLSDEMPFVNQLSRFFKREDAFYSNNAIVGSKKNNVKTRVYAGIKSVLGKIAYYSLVRNAVGHMILFVAKPEKR